MNFQKNRPHVVDGRAMPIGKRVLFVILPFGNPKRHRSRETWPHFDQALYEVETKLYFTQYYSRKLVIAAVLNLREIKFFNDLLIR